MSSLRPASKEYLSNRPTVLRFVESDFSLFCCLKFPFKVVKYSGWCVTKQKVFCFPNVVCKIVQVLYFELVISIALTNHEFHRPVQFSCCIPCFNGACKLFNIRL